MQEVVEEDDNFEDVEEVVCQLLGAASESITMANNWDGLISLTFGEKALTMIPMNSN